MRLAPDGTFAEGRYRLERQLGAGGMASVWLALDERLGRRVAVKVIADTLAEGQDWLTRFEREARAAAGLSHPSIVQVFDYGIEDGRPYLVMEYIPGVNLAERLADRSAPRPDPGVLARELLDALAHVHEAQITHRDIKPANILLDDRGRAHLTDFGIAQAEDAPSLTQTGMLIGTIKYLAPEVRSGHPATALSDLYSMGMVLQEVARDTPAPALASLIATLSAPEPSQRPGSAGAALHLLDSHPSRADPDATAPTRVAAAPAATRLAPQASLPAARRRRHAQHPGSSPSSAWLRSRGISPAVAAVTVLALVAVILIVSLSGGGDRPSRQPGATPTPGPARPSAPLDQQLDALKRMIDNVAPASSP